MLRKKRSVLLFLIFILTVTIFTSGCGGGASKEKEPNNSIDQANYFYLSFLQSTLLKILTGLRLTLSNRDI